MTAHALKGKDEKSMRAFAILFFTVLSSLIIMCCTMSVMM